MFKLFLNLKYSLRDLAYKHPLTASLWEQFCQWMTRYVLR